MVAALQAWWQKWNSTYHGRIYHRFGFDRCTHRSRFGLPCLRRWVQDFRCYKHESLRGLPCKHKDHWNCEGRG